MLLTGCKTLSVGLSVYSWQLKNSRSAELAIGALGVFIGSASYPLSQHASIPTKATTVSYGRSAGDSVERWRTEV